MGDVMALWKGRAARSGQAWTTVAHVAAAALLFVLGSSSAGAVDASCPKNELTASALAVAKVAAPTRAQTLKGLAENWQASLPEMMREIEQMKHTQADTWKPEELAWNIALTGAVRNILTIFDQAIPFFRKCDDEAVIKPLVWAARGNDRDLRINAANILANVVDNTTICFVLHHLYAETPALSDEARANLLGITRGMASYAYKDNADVIEKLVPKMQAQLGDRLKELTQTASLLVSIAARTTESQNRGAPLPGSLQRYCKGYKYDDPLN